MGYKDAVTINDVVLYVEEADRETIHILLAVNDIKMNIPGSLQFEIENETTKRIVIGKEWTINAQIIDIVKWIFIQSFANEDIENNFLYFSKLLQIIQTKQVTKLNFGMLGEILFAYQMKLGASDIHKWLKSKNNSFDFNVSDYYYEIKTKTIVEKEIILNLSYNQVTSLGNSNVYLILVDMNSGPYTIQYNLLVEYFQTLQLHKDSIRRILECLDVFNHFAFFRFNLLKYTGPAIKIILDEKIIGINCKVKFDAQYEFSVF